MGRVGREGEGEDGVSGGDDKEGGGDGRRDREVCKSLDDPYPSIPPLSLPLTACVCVLYSMK